MYSVVSKKVEKLRSSFSYDSFMLNSYSYLYSQGSVA